jgi:hypothetical protein
VNDLRERILRDAECVNGHVVMVMDMNSSVMEMIRCDGDETMEISINERRRKQTRVCVHFIYFHCTSLFIVIHRWSLTAAASYITMRKQKRLQGSEDAHHDVLYAVMQIVCSKSISHVRICTVLCAFLRILAL